MVNQAVICKMLRCLPSELEKEDYATIEKFMFIYEVIGEKNPFFVL